MCEDGEKGNKYGKKCTLSIRGGGLDTTPSPALLHRDVDILLRNEEYYTDFQLFPDISDVVEDNDNYKIITALIMNTKSEEK